MNQQSAGAAPVVRAALGWRAREVERESTAHVRFPDGDVSSAILEDDPVALVYADSVHGFTLPPGRFLRANQAAGRVYDVKTTPHLEALTAEAAAVLADSVGRLLVGAGWARVAGAGEGTLAAVRDAVAAAGRGNGGFGVTHVGTWRVARGAQPWAALPEGTRISPAFWNGVEALVTLRPVRAVSDSSDARLILQVALTDQLLNGELNELVEMRRVRLGGAMQTLSSWDRQPNESDTRRTP